MPAVSMVPEDDAVRVRAADVDTERVVHEEGPQNDPERARSRCVEKVEKLDFTHFPWINVHVAGGQC
jgi:hypothetical protein